MLPDADARLARGEPDVPALAAALDPDALIDRLRGTLPHAGICACRPLYVRYKPDTSCIVGLQVTGPEGSSPAYAKAHRRGDARKARKVVEQARWEGPFGPGAVYLDEGLAVSFFPNDRRLPALGRLLDPSRRPRALREALPGQRAATEVGLHALSYKPERRYVGRVDAGGGPVAVVRCYDQPGFASAHRAVAAVRSRGALRVPRLLGVSRRSRTIVVEWLQGDGDGGDGGAVTRRRRAWSSAEHADVGRALATLHSGPAADLVPLARDEEAARLRAAVTTLAAVSPDHAATVRTLGVQMAEALSAMPPARSPIHGDFSADQVVLGAAGAAIIDLDSARLGDPACDLGLFHATALADAVRSVGNHVSPDRRLAALLEGYRSLPDRTAVDVGRVERYVAIWLLRLAVEPFRHRWDAWPRATHLLVDEARSRWWACSGGSASRRATPDGTAA